MISLLFAMNGPRLTEEQAGAFSSFAQWAVIHERNGRLLVDGIGAQTDVERAVGLLTQLGRAPEIIGAWTPDGSMVEGYALNEAAWLAVAPDVPPATEGGQPTRPTAFADVHGWLGWEAKQIP